MHKFGYHFSTNGQLRFKDGRRIREGTTHKARNGKKDVKFILGTTCTVGLHASPEPYDAWDYHNGNTLSHVMVHGMLMDAVRDGDDKFVGMYRTYLRVVRISEETKAELDELHCDGNRKAFNRLCKRLLATA